MIVRTNLKVEAESYDPQFAMDVEAGLSRPAKMLPCRWFYDARGSALFERITRLPEYYPTRSEIFILEKLAPELAQGRGEFSTLVEFGSGSSRKTEIVLAALPALAAYAPIDVSETALVEATHRLRGRFPRLRIAPIVGDFAGELRLPTDLKAKPRIGFFPGSTIGNFRPEEAAALLDRLGEVLGAGARLLIGVDLRKSPNVLLPAYDDAQGVTAAFNLNVLARINAELDGDFDLSAFRHEAIWNEKESRIEMRLVSLRAQRAQALGNVFAFAEGERIHTENSYKHTIGGFQALAARGGWTCLRHWTDPARLFSVHELARTPRG